MNEILNHQYFSNTYRHELNNKRAKTDKTLFSFICTKAYVFKVEPVDYQYFKIIKDMKVYYNLFTDQFFHLRSFVLSDIEISVSVDYTDEVKEFKRKNKDFLILNSVEKKIETKPIKTFSLSKKLKKISILSRIRTNKIDVYQQLSDNEYSIKPDQNFSKIEIENLRKIDHCKNKCNDCKYVCLYRLSEINPNNDFLTNDDLILELKRHNHPMSRRDKQTNCNRTIAEAKAELYFHYISGHNQQSI